MQSAYYCDILEASITTDLQFYLFFFNSEKDFHYNNPFCFPLEL